MQNFDVFFILTHGAYYSNQYDANLIRYHIDTISVGIWIPAIKIRSSYRLSFEWGLRWYKWLTMPQFQWMNHEKYKEKSCETCKHFEFN